MTLWPGRSASDSLPLAPLPLIPSIRNGTPTGISNAKDPTSNIGTFTLIFLLLVQEIEDEFVLSGRIRPHLQEIKGRVGDAAARDATRALTLRSAWRVDQLMHRHQSLLAVAGSRHHVGPAVRHVPWRRGVVSCGSPAVSDSWVKRTLV